MLFDDRVQMSISHVLSRVATFEMCLEGGKNISKVLAMLVKYCIIILAQAELPFSSPKKITKVTTLLGSGDPHFIEDVLRSHDSRQQH